MTRRNAGGGVREGEVVQAGRERSPQQPLEPLA